MLAALGAAFARMLLSPAGRAGAADGQTGPVVAGGDHLDGDGGRAVFLLPGERRWPRPWGAPASLVLEEANPATMAVPAVPIAAQPLPSPAHQFPSLKNKPWNGS